MSLTVVYVYKRTKLCESVYLCMPFSVSLLKLHSLFKLCLSPASNRASFVIEINVAHTPWHALRQLLQYIYNINSNHICKHCYEFIISLNYVQQQ